MKSGDGKARWCFFVMKVERNSWAHNVSFAQSGLSCVALVPLPLGGVSSSAVVRDYLCSTVLYFSFVPPPAAPALLCWYFSTRLAADESGAVNSSNSGGGWSRDPVEETTAVLTFPFYLRRRGKSGIQGQKIKRHSGSCHNPNNLTCLLNLLPKRHPGPHHDQSWDGQAQHFPRWRQQQL